MPSSTFRVHHSDIELLNSPPRQLPALHVRFSSPEPELRRWLDLMCEYKDHGTPLARRHELRDTPGVRGLRLAIEGPDGQETEYFLRPPNGVAAPAMREIEDVPFGLERAS